MSQEGRPAGRGWCLALGAGSVPCTHEAGAGGCQEGFPGLGNCFWSLMPQGGYNHFGSSSGSVTSEKVRKSHEPGRAPLPLWQPRGVVERAFRQSVEVYIPALPFST